LESDYNYYDQQKLKLNYQERVERRVDILIERSYESNNLQIMQKEKNIIGFDFTIKLLSSEVFSSKK